MRTDRKCLIIKALQTAAYTIDFMLTNSLSVKVLRISFARKDEAAGNNEPPSRTNGLQVRREAQDFRRVEVKVISFTNVNG